MKYECYNLLTHFHISKQSTTISIAKLVKSFNCNVFLTFCSACKIYQELGIRFAAPHLPHRGQIVLLQCMKKVWETKMVVRSGTRTRRWFLMGGWATFVRDNGLRVGDICLFELKKKEELTMKVHIISREQF